MTQIEKIIARLEALEEWAIEASEWQAEHDAKHEEDRRKTAAMITGFVEDIARKKTQPAVHRDKQGNPAPIKPSPMIGETRG